MKSLIFKEVYIEGFKSIIKPLTYQLDKPGLNVIRGKNGSGKTTILEAIVWAFYRKTLKEGNSPEPYKFIRGKNFKGTLVRISFTLDGVDYEVFASHKYKGDFGIGKNTSTIAIKTGGEFKKGIRDISDGKKKVEELIGHSYSLFIHTIMFGQKLKRLIQESGPKRNEVWEQAFDVVFIKEAQEIAQKELQKITQEINLYEKNLEALDKEIAALKTQKQIYKENLTTSQDNKKSLTQQHSNLSKLIKDKEAEKKEAINKLEQLPKIGKKIANLEVRIEDYRKTNFRMEMEIENLKGDIEVELQKVIDNRPDRKEKICPSCGSKLKKLTQTEYKDLFTRYKNRIKEAQKNQRVVKNQIKLKEKTLGEGKIELEKCRKNLKKYESFINQKKGLEHSIESCNRNIKTLKESLKQIDLKRQETIIAGIKKNLSENILPELRLKRGEKKGLLKEMETLIPKRESLTWVAKEALSNKGLKAYVFSEKLRVLNRKLIEYSDEINYQIIFSINLTSKSKELLIKIFKGTNERKYGDLSGGQQQLVDVVVAFAFDDIKQEAFHTNVLFMDEIFEHLDEDNVEIINQLIQMKARNKSVHLITHLREFNTAASNVVTIKLNRREQTVIKNEN